MGDFFTESTVRANKQHQCCECRGTIKVADAYVRSAGAQDGSGFSYKTCLACATTRKWLDGRLRDEPFGLNDDEGIEFGTVRSELIEYLSDCRFECADGLLHLYSMTERKNSAKSEVPK